MTAWTPYRWTAPAASHLWELRLDMVENFSSHHLWANTVDTYERGSAEFTPSPFGVPQIEHTAASASMYLATARDRLNRARLVLADAETTDLTLEAAAEDPEQPLRRHRIPGPVADRPVPDRDAGFMVFTDPIGGVLVDELLVEGYEDGELAIPVVAAGWSLWSPDEKNPFVGPAPVPDRLEARWRYRGERMRGDGVWMTFYTPTAAMFGQVPPETRLRLPDGRETNTSMHAAMSGGTTAGEMHDAITGANAALAPVTEAFIPFDVPWDSPEVKASSLGLKMAQVLYSAFLMQTQPRPLLETTPRYAPRKVVKRAAKRKIEDDNTVHVVTLHQRSGPKPPPRLGPDGTERAPVEHDHRWWVRSHKRQQWYPSRGVHEEIQIPRSIKGPADKPLRTKKRVDFWTV